VIYARLERSLLKGETRRNIFNLLSGSVRSCPKARTLETFLKRIKMPRNRAVAISAQEDEKNKQANT